MDGRTYYMILGVPRTESPGGIRSAYRDLAKKMHPDVAGEQATRAFQEITEAYDVLSDPQRRRAYNDELRRAEGGGVVPVRHTPPPRTARPPVSIFGAAEAVRAADRLEGLNIEVVLTPEEWRRGCVLPVGVPVFRHIVRVRIPPFARSGSILETPLWSLGIHDFHLRLHVFVEPDVANERR